MCLNGTTDAAGIAVTEPTTQRTGTLSRNQIGMAGFAVFLLGAMAFVNPAMARECEDTSDLLRQAAGEPGSTSDQLSVIDAAIDQAFSLQASGDLPGCLAALARARSMLAGA